MNDLAHISGKLRDVLKKLEKVTDDLQTIQMQADSVANDDFLTREGSQKSNDD